MSNSVKAKSLLYEVIFAYLVVTGITLLLTTISLFVNSISNLTSPITILLFLLVPYLIKRRRVNPSFDLGMKEDNIIKDILFGILVSIIIFPPFWLATIIYWHFMFSVQFAFKLKLPSSLCGELLENLLLVALPEELFYRGYMQTRFKDYFILKRVSKRASIILAIIITSFLFSISHLVTIPNPVRLSVFFPSLVFGALREIRNSIYPSVVFHGLSNVFMDILIISYITK